MIENQVLRRLTILFFVLIGAMLHCQQPIENNKGVIAIDTLVLRKKMEFKKDTVVINTDLYASGNENNLKDILNRISEFDISNDGQVTFNGKSISDVSIENQEFFRGTNLAMNNIPFSSIDKVEVIDKVDEKSGKQKTQLNIKLKENKKNKIFGNISKLIGRQNFAIGTNLFKYHKNHSINIIGDNNTIGRPSLTMKDFIEFSGGVNLILEDIASFFSNKAFRELLPFIDTNNKLYAHNYFLGNNFSVSDKNQKLKGFVLYNSTLQKEKSLTKNKYFYTDTEDISDNQNNTSSSIFISKLGYDRKLKNGSIGYNLFLKAGNSDLDYSQDVSYNNSAVMYNTNKQSFTNSVFG